jgi:hypothetical protein
MNQDLSMRRAQSVIAFLEEVANISLTDLRTLGAMGETRPATLNGSPPGRAENRRAEIRILTNRGVPGERILGRGAFFERAGYGLEKCKSSRLCWASVEPCLTARRYH